MVHGNPTWSFYYRNLVEALPRLLPDDRPRPHRLRPLRQAGRRPLRLHAREPGRRPRSPARPPRGRPGDHPGRPRLGRDDRHGLRRPAPRADRPAGDPEHRGVPAPGVEAVPLAAPALPRHPARGRGWSGAERLRRDRRPGRLQAPADAAGPPRRLHRPLRLVGQPDRRPSGSSRTSRSGRATGVTTSSPRRPTGSGRSPTSRC